MIYLQFSHGESSPFLIWLFAPSLLLGMAPALLLSRARTAKLPGRAVRRIWNSAIATLSVGMLVRSVINISGRYTDYDAIYWITSGVLFLAAVACYFTRTTVVARETWTGTTRGLSPEIQVMICKTGSSKKYRRCC
ncbi:MAG: hypothetical protein GX417_10145 [Clostridiales bacterium]|nr:hypothetical protein [Clostridiales bacterium]